MADGAFLDAPVEVEQLVDSDGDALAEALAGGTHAIGMIEREPVRPADERPAAAGEEHPQVGVDLGDGADGAAAAGSEALLVDHDAGGDVPDRIDRRPGELRQPAAGVRAERLDELATSTSLRLCVRAPRISMGVTGRGHSPARRARGCRRRRASDARFDAGPVPRRPVNSRAASRSRPRYRPRRAAPGSATLARPFATSSMQLTFPPRVCCSCRCATSASVRRASLRR